MAAVMMVRHIVYGAIALQALLQIHYLDNVIKSLHKQARGTRHGRRRAGVNFVNIDDCKGVFPPYRVTRPKRLKEKASHSKVADLEAATCICRVD